MMNEPSPSVLGHNAHYCPLVPNDLIKSLGLDTLSKENWEGPITERYGHIARSNHRAERLMTSLGLNQNPSPSD